MNFLYGVPGKQTICEHALKGQTMTALGETQGEKTITTEEYALKGQNTIALGATQGKKITPNNKKAPKGRNKEENKMPQSLAQILLHITFSTKNREQFIQPDIENELYAYMATICNNMGCHAHQIGGISNHVHIACNLSRTVAVCDLLEDVKKYSSKWIKTKGRIYRNFAWQAGYGAFSLGMSQLDTVKKYIGRQKEHHRKKTFQEEYLELLKKYKVEYDERYIWD